MGSLPAGSNARVALRAATRSVHERMHVAPPFLALARGELTLRGYAGLLSKLAGYYFSVSEHLPIEPERLQRLRQDLAAVKAPAVWTERRSPPAGASEALGWRYVVEGSIFGGRVIHRQLDSLFAEGEGGRSFFLGTSTGVRHWQALCTELEDAGTAPGAIEQMTGGALDAFAAFEAVIAAKEPACA